MFGESCDRKKFDVEFLIKISVLRTFEPKKVIKKFCIRILCRPKASSKATDFVEIVTKPVNFGPK